MQYKFKATNESFVNLGESVSTIKYEIEAAGLSEIVEAFEMFLRGCGFSFVGHLDIVDDEPAGEP